MRQLGFWFGNFGRADPNVVPKNPPDDGKRFPCPWDKALTYENIKRVADYWCGGRGEEAALLPQSRFNEVLAVVLAKEMGEKIAAENQIAEARREKNQLDMRNGSRAQ